MNEIKAPGTEQNPPLPRRIYKLERYEDQHGRCLIARTQVPEQFPAVVVYTGTFNPKPLNGATFSFNINAISLEEAFQKYDQTFKEVWMEFVSSQRQKIVLPQ